MKYSLQILLPILCSIVLTFSAQAQCAFNLSTAVTPDDCFPDNTGAINLTVSNGTGTFSFLWSNGSNSEDLTGLTEGSYNVTVTDEIGCSETAQASISTGPMPIADAGPPHVLDCNIFSVTIGSSATSAGPTISYVWSGPDIQPNNFSLLHPIISQPGTYTLVVTDNSSGCTATDQIDISLDVLPPTAIAGPDRVLTCNMPQATLDGTGSSTGPPMVYVWSTLDGSIVSGNITLTPTVNQAAIYTLTVYNAQNGCTATDQTNVVFDFDAMANAGSDTGLPCGGGIVLLDGAGSSTGPTFSYIWSGPGINISNNFLLNPTVTQAGEYTLVVTNTITGCTASDNVQVFPGPAIPLQNFALTHLACLSGLLGAIDLTVNFGTSPHTFLWSNGATTEDINNLPAGTYQVVVTDATSCAYYANVVLNQAVSNIIINAVTTPSSCFGVNNGSIELTISNGTAPYTFAWVGPSGFTANTEDITGLASGNYSLTVTDANLCTKTRIINLAQMAAIVLPSNNISLTNPSCHGAANGAINITPIGGTLPYTYDWSNDGPENPDNDSQDLTGLTAGVYTITITDANGCSLVPSAINLSQPVSLLNLSAAVIPVPCGSAGAEGAIDLTVSGGTTPYTYVWGNGANVEDINTLAAGTYTVTITDNNGCTSSLSASVFVGGIIAGSEFSVTAASCLTGAMDGAITLNTLPPSAQAPLSFVWQGPAGYSSNSQNITGLAAGLYSITITDATDCEFIAAVTVDKLPSDLILSYGNTLITCTGGVVDLIVSLGVPPYTFLWSNGSTVEDLTYSAGGTYTVTVTDATGCTKTSSTTVLAPIVLNLTSSVVDVGCNGGNDGAINLTVTGGVPAYSYQWSNGATTQNLSGLASGSYCVTVTDQGGCTKVHCASVTQPQGLGVLISNVIQVSCTNSSDGAFTLQLLNAGAGPFLWSITGPSPQSGTSNSSTFSISGLSGGFHEINITNATGCTGFNNMFLDTPAPVLPSIEELSNTCNAAIIRANVTGGVAPLTFSWESAVTITATTQTIIAPVSSYYQVLVLDANGCGNFANITVTLANGGNCGYIEGFVRQDDNENCITNFNEPGLNGWLVRAEGADTLYGITDAAGDFLVGVPTGTYTMAVLAPNNLWTICPGAPQATVNMPNDTVFGGSFPVQKFKDCPALSISISTNQLRRCFSNNFYFVSYCNEGTAEAVDAYIDVTFDPFVIYQFSAKPSQDLGNNIRRFFIGNVGIGDCGTFYIRVSVSCSAQLGQTHCTEAHIFPDTICNANALWSGASLDVRSVCSNDSLRFILKNVGAGDMTSSVGYVVVEDAVMRQQAPVPLLLSGDSVIIAVPANGSTWHLESEQENFHPYPEPVALSVEGCTTSGSFSTGFVNQFAYNDAPPPVDIDCTTNVGSYDPNDKQGFPIGYGAAHYVRPGTEIEYLIRFQNTGTDTAFTVRVVDTLSSWLDPVTVQFGASSHPYRYDICGEGIVHFIFENIMLPDSNINEPASHGFAKFSVKPIASAPLETVVENTAAIYFDYNDPVVTNTTFHRLGENFVSVGVWQPIVPTAQVIARPNPFSWGTELEIKGLVKSEVILLQVFDCQGVKLREMESESGLFYLKKGDWPAGMYYFKIIQNGSIVGSGKLVAQ